MSASRAPTRTGIANLPLHYGKAPPYTAPLKEGLKGLERDLRLFIAGGKDGIPYPVDKKTYHQSIELLRRAINKTKLGLGELASQLAAEMPQHLAFDKAGIVRYNYITLIALKQNGKSFI